MRVVPDTNVWIGWSAGRLGTLVRELADRPHVLLASVSLQELLAGSRSNAEREHFEALFRLARRYRRLVNPPSAAWVLSGIALARLQEAGRVGPARLRALRNDVLLAATAVAHGAAVLTHNRADFALIRRVLPVTYVVAP